MLSLKELVEKNKFVRRVFWFLCDLFFSFLKKIHFLPRSYSGSIAVISFHKLGDAVFTIPAVKELQRYFNKLVFIYCFEETKPVYELSCGPELIVAFSHDDFYLNGRIAKRAVRKRLNKLNPEIVFDLTGSIISASILFNSKARKIIGINERYFKRIFTDFIPIRKTPHIMDIYIDAVKKVIPVENIDKIKEFPGEENRGSYILIHPYAGWAAKEWNMHKFISLAEKLSLNYEVKFVAKYGDPRNEVFKKINNPGIELLETEDTNQLLEIIRNCSLMVSNDSGPLYVANLLGKPTFTIYGPTNPDFHLPYGNKHKYIRQVIRCSPSGINKYCFTDAGRNGCPSFECMNQLEVDPVYCMVTDFIKDLNICAYKK